MSGFRAWNLRENVFKYDEYIKKCLTYTPYHLTEFLLAEETAEDGITKIFLYEEEAQFALFPMVIRRINGLFPLLKDEDDIYDMITPHEYGGILSNCQSGRIYDELLKNIFYYCRKNNIIFQFIRFNPYLRDLPNRFIDNNYKVIHSCTQVYVNLVQSKEEIADHYKSNVRRGIRRAKREDLCFEIVNKSKENIDIFQQMYDKAMERLNAEEFLYFNANYFYELMKCDCSRLCFVKDQDNTVIACSILLLGKDAVYYHLSCLDRKFAIKRPMNFLMDSMILWSKKMGYKIFHLGGGSKSLLLFKEGYSKDRIDYYIGYRVCDINKYEGVCNIWKKQFPQYVDRKYYPLYRYRE